MTTAIFFCTDGDKDSDPLNFHGLSRPDKQSILRQLKFLETLHWTMRSYFDAGESVEYLTRHPDLQNIHRLMFRYDFSPFFPSIPPYIFLHFSPFRSSCSLSACYIASLQQIFHSNFYHNL